MTKSILALFIVILMLGCTSTEELYFEAKEKNRPESRSAEIKTTDPGTIDLTEDEAAKHDNEDDCWIIVDDEIYDVTEFLDYNPQYRPIAQFCGADATVIFDKAKDESIPDKAVILTESTYIGDVQ